VAAALTTRVPVDVRLLDPIAARAVGAPGGSALLARPDGTPVGVLPAGTDPLGSLRAAVATLTAESTTSSRPASAKHIDHKPAFKGNTGRHGAPSARRQFSR
jgi:hypothetical protein